MNISIENLQLANLDIPFKESFSHASAIRDATTTAWVSSAAHGQTGHGESCPRKYVTGETMASVMKFFDEHKQSILKSVHNLPSLRSWIDRHRTHIDENPAAWCAIELAVLDLFGKLQDCSVEKLLRLPDLAGSFKYTAVLGDNEINKFTHQIERYALLGFTDYKVKLSTDSGRDREKLQALYSIIPRARIRLDANNLWQHVYEVSNHINSLSVPIFAIEEPLRVGDYLGLAQVSDLLNTKIVLDESFLREQQFAELLNTPSNWVINLRISKMGGLARSLAIVEKARELNIPIIIGAQVGETSLLTRAALPVANICRESLLAQEGAYGAYLLETDICEPSLTFGKGGVLSQQQLSQLTGRGFGLDIRHL